MIKMIYGIPRTGKSLFGGVVDGIIPALLRRRHVITNIPGLSPSGFSVFCHMTVFEVHQYLHFSNQLSEIISWFDSGVFGDAVYILDEFRALKSSDAIEETLTKRLNISGKQGIDWIFIAQLPSYFNSELRELAEVCSVFERGDRLKFSHSSIEWLFDVGTPKRKGKRWDTEHFQTRTRDPKYFSLYSSYLDQQFMAIRGEDHQFLVFWKTWAFKFKILGLIIMVLIGCGFIWFISMLKSDLGDKFSSGSKKPLASTLTPSIVSQNENSSSSVLTSCYLKRWIVNGKTKYLLKDGTVYVQINSADSILVCPKFFTDSIR